MTKPTVSIVMTTYDHAKYIIEAIDGVLMQICDFEIELIIANDNSPDNTDKVISDYLAQKKIQKNISILYKKHAVNKGAMNNFVWAMEQASGKYVAFCEGDDYWTDFLKLQTQVQFLEKNDKYSAIATNSVIKDEIQNIEFDFSKNEEMDVNLINIITGRKFHTATILFRNNVIKFPKNYNDFPIGDTLLFSLLAQNAPIKYIPIITAIYRKNSDGVTQIAKLQWTKKVEIFNIKMNALFKNEYRTYFEKNIYVNYLGLLRHSLKNKNFYNMLYAIYKMIYLKISHIKG